MSFVLDPSSVAAADRVELDLWSGPIQVKADGIDWGDTALEMQKGVGRWGEPVLDYRLPNRIVTAPLVLKSESGGDTMLEAMGNLQAKVARLATEGGHLGRTRGSLDLYADVVSASVVIPDTWKGENRGFEDEGRIVLECLPDFYGDEITLNLTNASTGYRIESWAGDGVNAIQGNYPGRTKITLTDTATVSRRGVGYGFRAKHYDSASTAALVYEAEALEALGQSTNTGSSISNSLVSPSDWTPVVGMRLSGGSYLTHVGTYRVFVRVYSSGRQPYLRLSWTQGDLIGYNDNPVVQVPNAGGWYLVDLGEIRLDLPSTGSPRWYGVVSALSESSTASNVYVDRFILQPRDETGAILYETPSDRMPPSGFTVNDPFNQTAGNLVGKTAVPSGTYAALVAGGTDFATTGSGAARRSAYGATNGVYRADGLALSLVDVSASVDVSHGAYIPDATPAYSGLLVRAVDSNNYLKLQAEFNQLSSWKLKLIKRVAGVETTLWEDTATYTHAPGTGYLGAKTLKLKVLGDQWTISTSAGGLTEEHTGRDSALAYGAALGVAGGVYIHDTYTSTYGSLNRDYDNFTVSGTIDRQVMYASRSLVIGTDECLRMSSDGNGYGPVIPEGDMPRIPVAGKEERTVELLLFSSPGDFHTVADSTALNFSAVLKYRPCWITVPEA